jgi:hypothetical protein
MGMLSAPTKDEISAGLADFLDGDTTVQAYVIGQRGLGRVAIVATDNAVYVVVIGSMKVKGKRQVARIPLGDAEIKPGLRYVSVGKETLKVGLADKNRVAELADYVNSRLQRPA